MIFLHWNDDKNIFFKVCLGSSLWEWCLLYSHFHMLWISYDIFTKLRKSEGLTLTVLSVNGKLGDEIKLKCLNMTLKVLFFSLLFRELGYRQIWKKSNKFRHILEATIWEWKTILLFFTQCVRISIKICLRNVVGEDSDTFEKKQTFWNMSKRISIRKVQTWNIATTQAKGNPKFELIEIGFLIIHFLVMTAFHLFLWWYTCIVTFITQLFVFKISLFNN